MTNKYRESFSFIFGYALDGALNIHEHCKVRENAEIVQELVSKETPIKTKAVEYAEGRYVGGCARCNAFTLLGGHYSEKQDMLIRECYCMHCGQKLDWSDE